MQRWKPQSSSGLWVGVVCLVMMFVGVAFFTLRIVRVLAGPPEAWPIDLGLYAELLGLLFCCVVVGVLAYRVASAWTLNYQLDRNGLYISWLGNRAVVPLDQIQSVDVGVAVERMPWRVFQGIGSYWGQGRTREHMLLHVFATRAPGQCLIIYMPNDAYAISPADQDAFVQDLEQRRNLGATQSLAPVVEPSRIFLYTFWNDGLVRLLLVLAFVVNLLVLAVLMGRYQQVPLIVQMQFGADGRALGLHPRHQVLFLPLAAFGLTLLNTIVGLLLYQRQQIGVRVLQGASVLVQVLFGIAVLTIIR